MNEKANKEDINRISGDNDEIKKNFTNFTPKMEM